MGKLRKAYDKMYENEDFNKAKPEYRQFAQNLCEIMKAKGLKVDEVAKAVGVGSSSITMYRKGVQFPSDPMKLCRLADALDTTVDALLDHDNPFYVQEEDLPCYAENLGVSIEALQRMKSISESSAGAGEALNALFSTDKVFVLMIAIKEAMSKANKFRLESERMKSMPKTFVDQSVNIVAGKIYSACRAFDAVLWDIVDYGTNEGGGNDGE